MEYRRWQGRSYLIARKKDVSHNFEEKMLLENRITGLLPFTVTVEEDDILYWYDITGYHDLQDMRSYGKPDRKFLKRFFADLVHTLRDMSPYLLEERGLILLPEMIFTEGYGERFLFCYDPGTMHNTMEYIRYFMECFLKQMEHQKQEDMQKCYEVYEMCQEKTIRYDEILSVLSKDNDDEEEHIDREEPLTKSYKDKVSEHRQKDRREGNKGYWNHLYKKIEIAKIKRKMKMKKGERENYVFRPEEVSEEPENHTVFLGSETEVVYGELKYEGEGTQDNFVMEQPIYLIGNQKEEVDGWIRSKTVSRVHARVTRDGDDYYIEDLNSTNGTYLNGEILNYKECVCLRKNDIVRFAEESYRFV